MRSLRHPLLPQVCVVWERALLRGRQWRAVLLCERVRVLLPPTSVHLLDAAGWGLPVTGASRAGDAVDAENASSVSL